MAGLLAQTYQDERAKRVRASLSFCGSVNCRHSLPCLSAKITDDVNAARDASADRLLIAGHQALCGVTAILLRSFIRGTEMTVLRSRREIHHGLLLHVSAGLGLRCVLARSQGGEIAVTEPRAVATGPAIS